MIPSSHDVYGDRSCGVISLKSMDPYNPTIGSNLEIGMYWGKFGVNVPGLLHLDQLTYIGKGSNLGNKIVGLTQHVYLPSDMFNGVQCPHDTDVYYNSSNTLYHQGPSPFLTDGSRNPMYYQTTSPSSLSNAFADFDGVRNTKKIITFRGEKDYSNWKPTFDAEDDFPAASCCDMFFTPGTKQGDWYLPACGELGYISPNFLKINNAIVKCENFGIELSKNINYLSSSVLDNNYIRGLMTNKCYMDYNSKNKTRNVRAFTRIK